jgi:hypothetical protein
MQVIAVQVVLGLYRRVPSGKRDINSPEIRQTGGYTAGNSTQRSD